MTDVALAPGEMHAAERPRREFLTCLLGGETYGVDILQVQEIREIEHVTRVPHVAPYVRGVINLRGAIVPVVDLGLMFGFSEPQVLKGSSAIVLDVDRRLVGLVVQSVADVVGLAEDEVSAAPDLGDRAISQALAGIGTRRDADGREEGASILLLDVEHVMRRIREDRE